MSTEDLVQATVQPAHTTTPWRYRKDNDGTGYLICADIYIVAEVRFPFDGRDPGYGHEAANAAFIVEAVNSYDSLRLERDALVAALTEIKAICEGDAKLSWHDQLKAAGVLNGIAGIARAALTAASETGVGK
jgi:hypothetical protein